MPKYKQKPTATTQPGERVSVNQLVSPTPGLIAQKTGFLITKRYKYIRVYVHQVSRLGYVYIQKITWAGKTARGKESFELFCKSCGFEEKTYHVDNGIFKAQG